MKRRILIIVAAVCCLLISGCVPKMKDISLEDYKLENISPVGMRGVDVTLALTIKNLSPGFTVADISGTVFKEGMEFALFSAEPITLKGKCTDTYPLNARLTLSDNVTFFNLLGLATDHDLEDFTVDLHARGILKGGLGKNIDKKNIPLSSLLKAFE